MSPPAGCPTEQELIDYCDGRLGKDRAQEIRTHLTACEACSDAETWIRDHLLNCVDEARRPPASGELESTQFLAFPGQLLDDTKIDRSLFSPSGNERAVGRLGKYDILGVLGQGGMGVVLQGHNAQLRRDVAIKMLNRSLAANPVARRRFIREARAAAAINHPHVVITHDVDEHRGIPFIVMEMVAGRTLHAEIRRQTTLDPIRVIRLSAQIAQGLASAHAQGVIHRDIKPGNIMLEDAVDRVKIADFGLARAAIDNIELTSRELAVGTPAYMSPEQVRGEDADARSDLFALGCVIHAMLTGHSPFHGRSALEMARKVETHEPLNLHEVNPATPVFLAEIVDKLLAKDPDQRYQSAAEVADVLNRHLAILNQAHSDEIGNLMKMRTLAAGHSPESPMADRSATGPSVDPGAPATTARRSTTSGSFWLPLVTVGATLAMAAVLMTTGLGDRLFPDNRPGAAGEDAASVGADAAGKSSGDTSGETSEPDRSPGGAADVTPQVYTVAQNGEADFASIREALQRAGQGATIRVLDDATYEGGLELGGARQAGITLVSDHHATLAVPDSVPGERHTLTLRDARDVTVRGFTIRGFARDGLASGHAILVAGAAGGVMLEDLRCEQAASDGPYATVQVFVSTASPGAAPLRIAGCEVINRGTSQCIWVHQPAHDIVITGNSFSSNHTNLALWHSCRRLEITGNIFQDALDGIGLATRQWPAGADLRICNNTFLSTVSWIAFDPEAVAGREGTLVNNLVLGSKLIGMTPELQDFAIESWTIRGNVWERGPETSDEAGRQGAIARLIPPGSVDVNRDPRATDYLVPPIGSELLSSGCGGKFPSYVGAKDRSP